MFRPVSFLKLIAILFYSYSLVCGQNEKVAITSLQTTSINNNDGNGAGLDCYTQYTGNGSVAAGWPPKNTWVSFSSMWNNNLVSINNSCNNIKPPVPTNSAQETTWLYNAIQSLANATYIDHRVILAIVLQESHGCVRAKTTYGSVPNPGLMQSYNGSSYCNVDGSVYQNPCPQSEIVGMITDGAAGTHDEAQTGLADWLSQAGATGTDVSAYYKAARIYNSGSIDPSHDLEKGGATHCYSSDIANWLTGWAVATSQCTFDGQFSYVSACPALSTATSTISSTSSHTSTATSKVTTTTTTSSSTCTSLVPSNPGAGNYWYASIAHNGISPFITQSSSYTVFRNVVTGFGADNSGAKDASPAIQSAISQGSSQYDRTSGKLNVTGQPAVVYLPAGTYLINSPIKLFVGTVLVGDATNPPTIKASSSFTAANMIIGEDPVQEASSGTSTTEFYIAIKNLIVDSTALGPSQPLTLIEWSMSQATQLSNIVFNMPTYSTGHTGVSMVPVIGTPGSATYFGDLTFNGGVSGVTVSTQQLQLKGMVFNGCTTGITVDYCYECVFVGMTFINCGTGVDMTASTIGSVVLLDSNASNLGTVVSTATETSGTHSLILENVAVVAGTFPIVSAGSTPLLSTAVTSGNAWVYGNSYVPGGPSTGSHQTGTTYTTPRSTSLLSSNGAYIALPPPTYANYSVSQVVNVKSVSGYMVYGNGVNDDTVNVQYILNIYAGCKILYFPAGTYLFSNTVTFPPGSRIIGDAYGTMFSATGTTFKTAAAPIPMIRVGASGAIGVAQFTDIIFTVADILPGCMLVEVNMAGVNPGDVGFWNSHFRIGGAMGSNVQTNCGGSPASCMAAFGMMHLTSTSSAYIENMWGWTADHDLDGTHGQTISTGRGLLIEATKATWLHGMAFEHNTLYQFNYRGAQNVFCGFHQSETPYWQGSQSSSPAPAPWTPNSQYGDPTFSNCDGSDTMCPMAWFDYINNSNNLFLYGSGFWAFFNGADNSDCSKTSSSVCQTNAIWVNNTCGLYYYAINTLASKNMIVNNGAALALTYNNPGPWQGVIAAFLTDEKIGSCVNVTSPTSTTTSQKSTTTTASTTSSKTSTTTTSSKPTSTTSTKQTTTLTSLTSKTTSVSVPSPTPTGIISTCNAYYKVVSGDTCSAISKKYGTFTVAQFESWNGAINSGCTNLVIDDNYCVGVSSSSTSASSTKSPTTSSSTSVKTTTTSSTSKTSATSTSSTKSSSSSTTVKTSTSSIKSTTTTSTKVTTSSTKTSSAAANTATFCQFGCPGVACSTDDDCFSSNTCNSGVCGGTTSNGCSFGCLGSPCDSYNDCSDPYNCYGSVCGGSASCSFGCAGFVCSNDNDCADPYSCYNGICGASASCNFGCDGFVCGENADCASPYTCSNGYCG